MVQKEGDKSKAGEFENVNNKVYNFCSILEKVRPVAWAEEEKKEGTKE